MGCNECRSIKRFLCILACKDENPAFCAADDAITAEEERRLKMGKSGNMDSRLFDLGLMLFALALFAGICVLCVLCFAEALDGPSYKQNAEHLKSLMQIEQSQLNATKEALKHEETP